MKRCWEPSDHFCFVKRRFRALVFPPSVAKSYRILSEIYPLSSYGELGLISEQTKEQHQQNAFCDMRIDVSRIPWHEKDHQEITAQQRWHDSGYYFCPERGEWSALQPSVRSERPLPQKMTHSEYVSRTRRGKSEWVTILPLVFNDLLRGELSCVTHTQLCKTFLREDSC